MLRDRQPPRSAPSRARGLLVAGEVALSIVVLISGGLFVRTLQNTEAIQPGFDTDRVVTMPIDVGRRGYSEDRGREFYRQLIARVSALPGVGTASLAITLPLGGSWRTGIHPEGQATTEPDIPCDYDIVAPRFFETIGIPLIAGRDFTDRDRPSSPEVVIVNETLARRLFSSADPLGKRLSIPQYPGDTAMAEIVGLARDAKYERLTETPRMYLYLPLAQRYAPGARLLVRVQADASLLARALPHEVAAIDAAIPVSAVRPLADRLRASLAPRRTAAELLTAFALLGLAIASVGLYGLLSYSVGQRRQEIGLRMALGARVGDILRLIVGQALLSTAAGVVAGLAIAGVALRSLTSQLYGLSFDDPLVYAAATGILVASAVVACYVPARRAATIDPLTTLRQE